METIRKIDGMNLFQMYEKNNYQYGFWFSSWKWANTCARLLYFEYHSKKIDENTPINVFDDQRKYVGAVCEFWNIRKRELIKTDYVSVPWNNENYLYWQRQKVQGTLFD